MARPAFRAASRADPVGRHWAGADFPGLNLFASNDRTAALDHLADAEVVIGHHFQFDADLVRRAPKLQWIQSLTTGTDAILRIDNLPRRMRTLGKDPWAGFAKVRQDLRRAMKAMGRE